MESETTRKFLILVVVAVAVGAGGYFGLRDREVAGVRLDSMSAVGHLLKTLASEVKAKVGGEPEERVVGNYVERTETLADGRTVTVLVQRDIAEKETAKKPKGKGKGKKGGGGLTIADPTTEGSAAERVVRAMCKVTNRSDERLVAKVVFDAVLAGNQKRRQVRTLGVPPHDSRVAVAVFHPPVKKKGGGVYTATYSAEVQCRLEQ